MAANLGRYMASAPSGWDRWPKECRWWPARLVQVSSPQRPKHGYLATWTDLGGKQHGKQHMERQKHWWKNWWVIAKFVLEVPNMVPSSRIQQWYTMRNVYHLGRIWCSCNKQLPSHLGLEAPQIPQVGPLTSQPQRSSTSTGWKTQRANWVAGYETQRVLSYLELCLAQDINVPKMFPHSPTHLRVNYNFYWQPFILSISTRCSSCCIHSGSN